MIRLYPSQLEVQLKTNLYSYYLLIGNDILLLQESQNSIYAKAHNLRFNEHYSIVLDEVTDWDTIHSISKTRSLFASRQTLLLIIPEKGITAMIEEKLVAILGSLLNKDLLLILRSNKMFSVNYNSKLLKVLSNYHGVLVNCTTPEPDKLPLWVHNRAKKMQLSLDNAACQLLCYCYEGNLSALVNVLELLKLMYTDGILTLPRVEQSINDSSHFTIFNLINTILEGNHERASHIIHKLRLVAIEPVILLRYIQQDVLLLLNISNKINDTPIRILFDQHKIWINRRPLLLKALKRINLQRLYKAITLILKIELTIKNTNNDASDSDYIWANINNLALLLCCSNELIPAEMIEYI
ncbi:DNA polymerase III subunit delta [Candidatus Palibaumannia cicadellinicola]|uniref:DNA polymerase III subunit delta n=1 Tax=Candidatus Palibaumannia cicadellinicola TaxID=186490 RepID=A0A0K2BKF1_9GAMM|nr:DNA polymerase III subunit delta [Candidatus Baumannia cicadellinicola]AKZ65800.1 DNA polymerase III delta subunit [Candidatus Baumannia cicadellinicola]